MKLWPASEFASRSTCDLDWEGTGILHDTSCYDDQLYGRMDNYLFP